MKLFPSAKGIGFTVALCICQIITTLTEAEEVAPPKLEAVRKDETGFRIRVEGENAKKYLLEHSQDLVDWETLGEVTLDVGTSLEVLDADVAGGKKFYRASEVILSALQPGTAIILAGDVIILRVLDGSGIQWKFSVNGVEGGNDVLGTITRSPIDGASAFFTAPLTDRFQRVTVCATDPDDPTNTACASIEIRPLSGNTEVRPGVMTMGLGVKQTFLAGANVAGVGFVPFTRVYWKVNGEVGGNGVVGTVGFDGTYSSPLVMPATLPVAIQVGFSLTVDGPVLASAAVTLAELKLTPPEILSIQPGPAGKVTATLNKSDGVSAVMSAAEVSFQSGSPGRADVNAQGDITIGDQVGIAVIEGRHHVLGLTASMIVQSRSDVHVRLQNVNVRTEDEINLVRFNFAPLPAIREIEVTRPGVMFNLMPQLYAFRGRLNVLSNNVMTGGGASMKLDGDGTNVLSYAEGGPVPQTTGLVATIEEDSGFVEVGDKPGTGTIYAEYDDGFLQRWTSMNVIFTRLNLEATARSAVTQKTNEAYISEWVNIDVGVTNARSSFIGRTPIRVRLENGEKFWAAYPATVRADGLRVPPDPEHFVETDDLTVYIASGYRNFHFPDPSFGKTQVRLAFKSPGEQKIIVSVPNDPGIPPQEFAMQVKRPQLRIRKGAPPELVRNQPGYGATTGSVVVANSWIDVEPDGVGPSPAKFPITAAGPSELLSDHDPVVWRIQRPDGSKVEIPAELRRPSFIPTGRNFLSSYFRERGTHLISMGLSKRSELRTEELAITVVGPLSQPGIFLEIDTTPKKEITQNGLPVPTGSQLGGVQIIAPTSGGWVKGVPIDVTLQCYSGEGVPKIIGKKVLTRNYNLPDPDAFTLSTNYVLAGTWCFYVYGPSITFLDPGIPSIPRVIGSSPALPDNNGRIQFQFAVQGPQGTDYEKDVVVVFVPALFSVLPTDLNGELNLPVETVEVRNGQVTGRTAVPIGITDYQDAKDQTFLRQALMMPGNGVAANPRFVPVATQRARDAITNGLLPQKSDQVVVRVIGSDGFGKSLDAGLPTVNAGIGLEVLESHREGNGLVLTLGTDLAYFSGASQRYGTRTLNLTFPNGMEAKAEIQTVGYSFIPAGVDYNLPMNAAYGFEEADFLTGRLKGARHPDAAVPLEVKMADFSVVGRFMQLELRTSIHACWDTNKNGVADAGEDLNRDGWFTVEDNQSGIPFRGRLAENPLVGFSRRIDPSTGQIQVRNLTMDLIPGGSPTFYIHGNNTDRHRLDRRTMTLGSATDPDLLPDFVSRIPNGELLIGSIQGGIVDVLPFTAYAAVANVESDIVDPNLAFDQIKTNRDNTYSAYSQVNDTDTLQNASTSDQVRNSVSVFVDHEAGGIDLAEGTEFLKGLVPFQYYAGILDQYFERRVGGFADAPVQIPMGKDGRVRGYAPRGRVGTGEAVGAFGIELDGILFDAGWLSAPEKPTYINPLPDLIFAQRFDLAPNSPILLGLPVVQSVLGLDALPTDNNLIKRIGGSSGGYYHMERWNPGKYLMEAKTPGSDFGGLHAGYLLFGRPEQLIHPFYEYRLDDIREVISRRNGEPGEAAGTALQQEKLQLGNVQPRWVHGFAQNEDKKEPIRTAIKSSMIFKVRTDPEGVIPADTNTFKIKPVIVVREKAAPDEAELNLLVTSQSRGNEKTMKILADAAVDLAVDLTATAILTVITEGAYLEACGVSVGGIVKSAALNLGIGLMESEYLEPYGIGEKKDGVAFVNQLVNDGFTTPIPGVTVPGLSNFEVPHGLVDDATRLQKFLSPAADIKFPSPLADICTLVNTPISMFKDSIKATYSAETFGGLGSAEASATKTIAICIPRSAQLTNGIFSLYASMTRSIQVLPEEPSSVQLRSLPYQDVFGDYPYSDKMSDTDFIKVLLIKSRDPVVGKKAIEILRAVGRKSVWRESESDLYQDYKIRGWRLPGVTLTIAPGQNFGNGVVIGDFELTPGETEIPVSAGAAATVARSNENSGGRAMVRSSGYEMVLVRGVLFKKSQF